MMANVSIRVNKCCLKGADKGIYLTHVFRVHINEKGSSQRSDCEVPRKALPSNWCPGTPVCVGLS